MIPHRGARAHFLLERPGEPSIFDWGVLAAGLLTPPDGRPKVSRFVPANRSLTIHSSPPEETQSNNTGPN